MFDRLSRMWEREKSNDVRVTTKLIASADRAAKAQRDPLERMGRQAQLKASVQHAQHLFGRGELSGGSATDATTSDVLNLVNPLNAGYDRRDGLSPQRLERKPEQRLGFAGGKD